MVEIIPKPITKPLKLIDVLFYFSLILLILALASYFGLDYLQKKKSQELEDINSQLLAQETPEQKSLEKEVFTNKKKIDAFSILFASHQSPDKLFTFLENLTHPKVIWTQLSFISQESKLVLAGQTESFQTLGQQILIFKEEKLIQNINLSNISLGRERGVSFNLSFDLDPQVLK